MELKLNLSFASHWDYSIITFTYYLLRFGIYLYLVIANKILPHPVLRNKARCILYMRQEDNIYNNRAYGDKCHNNQSIYYIAEVLQNKR
jgi:hypothetical protein